METGLLIALAILVVVTLLQCSTPTTNDEACGYLPQLPAIPPALDRDLADLERAHDRGVEYATEDQIGLIWNTFNPRHNLTTSDCYWMLEQWRKGR